MLVLFRCVCLSVCYEALKCFFLGLYMNQGSAYTPYIYDIVIRFGLDSYSFVSAVTVQSKDL